MKKCLFIVCLVGIVLFGYSINEAGAYWHTQLEAQTYAVNVHPNPYWTGSGWVVPAPYVQNRTHYTRQRYWVQPMPTYIVPRLRLQWQPVGCNCW